MGLVAIIDVVLRILHADRLRPRSSDRLTVYSWQRNGGPAYLSRAHRTRKIAQVRDKALDYRIERSILQRYDYDRPRPIRQIDGQHLD